MISTCNFSITVTTYGNLSSIGLLLAKRHAMLRCYVYRLHVTPPPPQLFAHVDIIIHVHAMCVDLDSNYFTATPTSIHKDPTRNMPPWIRWCGRWPRSRHVYTTPTIDHVASTCSWSCMVTRDHGKLRGRKCVWSNVPMIFVEEYTFI